MSAVSIWFCYTGARIHDPSGATDFTMVPNGYWIDHAEGSAVIRFDENGFNNLHVDGEQVDVLLMGDSQVQATHVPQDSNIGYLLNQMNPSLRTYNIAVGSHGIYTWVKNMENAVRAYSPTQYVFVDVLSVAFETEKMRAVIEDKYETMPSYDAGLIYAIQKYVPGIKRMYKNMEDWLVLNGEAEQTAPVPVDFASQEYAKLLDGFLKKAKAPVEQAGAKLAIFYMPLTALDADGALVLDTDPTALEVFRATCESNGIVFIDLSEDYRKLYAQEHKLPYGFANTRVGNGHMNVAGYRVVAERLSRELAALTLGE